MALIIVLAPTQTAHRKPDSQHQANGFDEVWGHFINPISQGLTTNAINDARPMANIQMMVPVTTLVRMESVMPIPRALRRVHV